jgi:hypothetical protein
MSRDTLILLLCAILWFVPCPVLWACSKKLRASFPKWRALFSVVRSLAIASLFAPSVIHGGMAVVPAPASVALVASLMATHSPMWDMFWLSFGSLTVCSAVIFLFVYFGGRPSGPVTP